LAQKWSLKLPESNSIELRAYDETRRQNIKPLLNADDGRRDDPKKPFHFP